MVEPPGYTMRWTAARRYPNWRCHCARLGGRLPAGPRAGRV